MQTPLVSVVITAYNHGAFIADCLDSVLNQKTSFRFEILVGEDDSTDGTQEILEGYEKFHPEKIRVFYRDKKDKLVINGRLTGRYNLIETMKEASGKYIATLDGDDYWISPEKLQRQVDVLESDDSIAICHHGVVLIDDSGEKLDKLYEAGKQLANIIDVASGRVSVLHSTRVFRVSKLTLPGWLYETSVGDIPLTLITCDGGVIYCIKEDLGAYRIHSLGLHQGKTEIDKLRSLFETWKVVQKNLSYFKTDIRKEVERIIFFAHFGLAKNYYCEQNFSLGWKQQRIVLGLTGSSPRKWAYGVKLFLDMFLGLKTRS